MELSRVDSTSSLTSAAYEAPPTLRSHHWATSAVAWTVVAFAAAGLFVRDAGTMDAWARSFGRYLIAAVPWVIASPLIARFARRVPLASKRWPVALGIHVVGGLTWTTIAAVLTSGLLALLDAKAPATSIGENVSWARPDLWADYALYWAVVLVGEIAGFNERLRASVRRAEKLQLENAQLEAGLATARLQSLRARMEPHFLFNALNSVSALVRRGDSTGAISMLSGVGELLRHAISKSDTQTVSLGEELAMVRRYLEIEQVRVGNRLEIQTFVPSDLLDVPIPALLLQPLAENAVRHGVAQVSGPATIRIVAARLGRAMKIEVFNTGPSLPTTNGNGDDDAGLGVSITRSRLRLLYGTDASFALRDAAGGVRAVIELPLQPVRAPAPNGHGPS